MKVVIDIDETDYRLLKHECIVPIKIDTHIYEAIRNGTVLSKGYGDLISREALKKALNWIEGNPYIDLDREIMQEIDNAPTIEPDNQYNKGFNDGLNKACEVIEGVERPKGECVNYIHKYKCPVYNENPDNCKKCDRNGHYGSCGFYSKENKE